MLIIWDYLWSAVGTGITLTAVLNSVWPLADSEEKSMTTETEPLGAAPVAHELAGLCQPYFRRLREESPAIRQRVGNVSYAPTAVARAHDYPLFTGKGQVIGILELGGAISAGDYLAARRAAGQGTNYSLAVVLVDGATQVSSDADGEVNLDLQVAGTIAPDAAVRMYFAPNTEQGYTDALAQMVKDGCTVGVMCWGAPEDAWSTQGVANMNAVLKDGCDKGVTWCVASGDSGSSDGESGNHVDFPASSPYVLSVGGTSLMVDGAGKRQSEVVWNSGSTGGSTGGGVSALFARPGWQPAASVPGGGRTRGVPDFAEVADPGTGIEVYVNGVVEVYGGTSAAAPMLGGQVALLNEALGRNLGYANAALYQLTAPAVYDVTQGNNGTYVAKAGYDCCTGNGVLDGQRALAALKGTPPVVPPVTGVVITLPDGSNLTLPSGKYKLTQV